MQFVLMVFQGSTPLPGSPEWEDLPKAEQQAVYREYDDFNKAEGVTAGLPLGLPAEARTVTVADGTVSVSDGPYLKDPMMAAGGYSVVEVDDMDAAIRLAARIPAARLGGGVEIRPVSTYW